MRRFVVLALLAAGIGGPLTQTDKVTPWVPMGAEPFALEEVRLLDGPFRHAMELDHAYLLSLEPARLLHSWLNAGLPPMAKPCGGWMTLASR